MTTPEGDVKKDIDKVLAKYEPDLWWHKPVQNGMGKPCLDYHCCYTGLYFAIEAKAADKDLTDRQQITRDEIIAAGGTVFRVRNAQELSLLQHWLAHPKRNENKYIYWDGTEE